MVEPIATVVDNNQPHWKALVETAPNVTLPVGMRLNASPIQQQVEPGFVSEQDARTSWTEVKE